ncbi:MAG: 4-alpha-glucanotransferase [Alphaproteobacteria bacterium]|nr:4-alpha-glucanotransferase [Alphaproteobacteria bacterium]
MSEALHKLAQKAGVAVQFADAGLNRKSYDVDANVIRFVLNDIGYPCANDDEAEASLAKIELERWQKTLEYIYVRVENNIVFDVVHPATEKVDEIILFDEKNHKVTIKTEMLDDIESKFIDNIHYLRKQYKINTPLNIGYYVLAVKLGDKIYRSRLAVAPQHSFEPEALKHKTWGFAVQLYSVNSKRNWGVGDFTDLSTLVNLAAESGASIIGLNPLNTLSHDYPENASPYQSISRLYLNPIYIDLEKVPEFEDKDKNAVADKIADIKKQEFINYDKIYHLKTYWLEQCYERMLSNKNSGRYTEFMTYCGKEGRELEKLAAFQAIYEQKTKTINGGWCAWQEELRSPDNAAVADYVRQNQKKVDFFKFMQFEASRQFAMAHNAVQKSGMQIGFYRDLAVGVGKDSAEFWGDKEIFIPQVGAGAPPDAFFPCGQKWGLGCFSPKKLKEHQYEPFIKVLRANMQNAGAIRVDHVMSLMRLFVIPDDMDCGTYVYYNFEDMLNLLTLESRLNKCMIVGESIGNVPDGFIEALQQHHIYSLSVLWAERAGAGWGGFYAPEHYPSNAVTSVGTHDMPPLKMWWFGYDIELAYSLKMMSEEEKVNSYHKREADRKHLLDSLDAAHIWPEDKLRQGNYLYGESYPEGLEEAVHRFMSKSASRVFLLQLEDVLQVDKQQNLPGTDVDTYPNWRHRLPVALEDLPQDERYIRNINAIRKER